jgi:hypothetical protein
VRQLEKAKLLKNSAISRWSRPYPKRESFASVDASVHRLDSSRAFSHGCISLSRYSGRHRSLDPSLGAPVRLAQRSDFSMSAQRLNSSKEVFWIRQSLVGSPHGTGYPISRSSIHRSVARLPDGFIAMSFERFPHRDRVEPIESNSNCLCHLSRDHATLGAQQTLLDVCVSASRFTADDLQAKRDFEPRIAELGHTPRIAVTGASGLVGRRVVELACVLGWHVVRVARPNSQRDSIPFPRSVETAYRTHNHRCQSLFGPRCSHSSLWIWDCRKTME